MRYFLLLMGVLSVLALYMLAMVTGSGSRLVDYFWLITAFSAFLILALVLCVFQQLLQLWRDHKNHVYGAKLSRKLVVMFTWVAVLPAVFLFGISVQFITHSINSWFGDEMEEVMDSSIELSKLTLQVSLNDTLKLAENFALLLNEDTAVFHKTVEESVDDLGQIMLYDVEFKPLASYPPINMGNMGNMGEKVSGFPPVNKVIQKHLATHSSYLRDISFQGHLFDEVWLRLDDAKSQAAYLVLRKPVPESVMVHVHRIESARSKYAEIKYAKKGLETFFLMTLIIATLLAILMALLAAIYYARRFISPLKSLDEATQAVAQGDFTQKTTIFRSDELGILSARFNRMTAQLQLAKNETDALYRQQESARTYLEFVLSSLTTGVMTFDEQYVLKTYNESAVSILDYPLHSLVGSNYQVWHGVSVQANLISGFIEKVLESKDTLAPVEVEYGGSDRIQILLGRSKALENHDGYILVFDDITQLMAAQKEAAWGEVARRLAHEIRNPLTPIQLSAERLAWKLTDKLDEADTQILCRSTDTIVKQVDALKEMVEGFRNYARSASLKLKKEDLNELVSDVLALYEGLNCDFLIELSQTPIWVKIDSTAMRQVLHNILKNATEATQSGDAPRIKIKTFVTASKEAVLSIDDNGPGFAPGILHHLFEPYVTDKKNGTGLGMTVVKKIIEEHNGRISVGNKTEETGAWLLINLPLLEAQ